MKPHLRRIVVTSLILGMVISFLFTQPGVRFVIVKSMNYLYSFLPKETADFLRSQTLLSLVFFWGMIFVGFTLWLIRGEFYRAEPEPRESNFELIEDSESSRDEPPYEISED